MKYEDVTPGETVRGSVIELAAACKDLQLIKERLRFELTGIDDQPLRECLVGLCEKVQTIASIVSNIELRDVE